MTEVLSQRQPVDVLRHHHQQQQQQPRDSSVKKSRTVSLLAAVTPATARLRSISFSRKQPPANDENVGLDGASRMLKASFLGRRPSTKAKQTEQERRESADLGAYARSAAKFSKSSPDLSSANLFHSFASVADLPSTGQSDSASAQMQAESDSLDRSEARAAALAKLTEACIGPASDLATLVAATRQILRHRLSDWVPDQKIADMDSLTLWTMLRDGQRLCFLLNVLLPNKPPIDPSEVDSTGTREAATNNIELFLLAGRCAFEDAQLPWFSVRDLLAYDNASLANVLRLVVALDAVASDAAEAVRPPVERRDSPKRLRAATTLARSSPSITFAADPRPHAWSESRPTIYADRRKAESAVELSSVAEELEQLPLNTNILVRSKTARVSHIDVKRHKSDSPNARRRHRLSSELSMSARPHLHVMSPPSGLRRSVDLVRSDSQRTIDSAFSSNDDEPFPASRQRPVSASREPRARPQMHQRWDSEVYIERSSFEGSAVHRQSRDAADTADTRLPKNLKIKLVLRERNRPTLTYQLGECIGRGQFGAVYRALNLNSGRIVAVKRIALEDKSEDEIEQLSHEVDLLKRLEHAAVVKYEGLVRTQHYLNIILEFVENGSLLTTLKHFGELPESLVASYVVKILEGLTYLHSQNVVHCDLKAANILTTKNGNVKLSDFGVSLNLNAVQNIKQDIPSVNGTPYWMAPEVIELQGATYASDIWSLGCTIIELCTGRPPYADLVAMSAMFRIVTDDGPAIPPTCSDDLKDFLRLCFSKDPKLRPTARQLLAHPWLQKNWDIAKDLRPQDSLPFLRRISTEMQRPTAGRSFMSLSQSTSSLVTRIASTATSPVMTHSSSYDSPDAVTPVAVRSHDDLAALLRKSMDERRSLEVHQLRSSQEVSLRAHAFINTTFSKAVDCKLCGETTKRHAVLCKDCGLVAHSRCVEFAPLPCDLRSQLLGYTNGLPVRPAGPRQSSSSSSTFNLSQVLPFSRPRWSKASPTTPPSTTRSSRPARSSLSPSKGRQGSSPPGSLSSANRGTSFSSFSASADTHDSHDIATTRPSLDVRRDESMSRDERNVPLTTTTHDPLKRTTSIGRSKLQKRDRAHSRTQSANVKEQCSVQ